MEQKTKRILDYFKKHGGVARFSSIIKSGFHPDMLSALEKEGKIEKIARGLYRMSHYTFGSYPDLVIASLQAPRGTVCLVSALAFHEAEGHKIRVYNLAKTIADCFKFRNRIGVNVVRDALKIAITEKGIKPQDIMKYAKICRVHKIVKPILETMI